ncbi:MAG: preprotein translocase subunit SecA [Chlamydiae bacterium RIFCSPHIGHO2_12_FULL_49_11]|nr:MAG: preprotein translocase subunit SecA [Chlamydiae bacterium RIFCSPHIGHO2_12_FULL_49_11]
MGLLQKIFGTQQTRTVKKYFKTVKKINEVEIALQNLSDEDLKKKTGEFRERLKAGETVDDLLVEAFAVVKNACRRLIGTGIHVSGYEQKWDMIPYDVQLVGAIALHKGSIAEMQTGEGKTLTAAMPLYLHALTGKPVHLVTVNDYLVRRDNEWIGEIFRFLGLTVTSLVNDTPHDMRKSVYAADIVYGTSSQFGFDYLRDNSMTMSKEQRCQRGHYFAVIDEIDSILIDEARTPLIISGPSTESRQMYDSLEAPVRSLVKMQRDICNKLASEAKRSLENLGIFEEEFASIDSLEKDQRKELFEIMKKLWVVSKGMPHNKLVRKIRENADLRYLLETVQTYFFSDQNKEEKNTLLKELYIVIDERSNDYELTDRGMSSWSSDENDFVMLDLGEEYTKIEKDSSLSEDAVLEKKTAVRALDASRKEKAHNIRQLFKAFLLMEKDVDYIVQDGEVIIIDENTGRPQPGRRFSDGLHQAIEAKENVSIQRETQTYATITLQNYFRMYDKLAGMTGTAITEAQEFKEIYRLDVLVVPTHKLCVRKDSNDEVYITEREKFTAILREIDEMHTLGRPILIGTESVEISEKLSRILRSKSLVHEVLNAKNHAKEAEIIAGAGKRGAITVATNMAGRGTDIKLGPDVPALGGLHIIGTSRHESRRIDRQLRGRAARQGDPGSSKFFLSFEDKLVRLFASQRVTEMIKRFRPPEGEAVSAKIIDKSIETAQKRIEGRNRMIRKHTLEYDDVMNKHREEVYQFRNELLERGDIIILATEVLESTALNLIAPHFENHTASGIVSLDLIRSDIQEHFPITIDTDKIHESAVTEEEVETLVVEEVLRSFKTKMLHEARTIGFMQKLSRQEINPISVIQELIRSMLIQALDNEWQKHLRKIDYLQAEVSLASVAQKDPLTEFKHRAFELFQAFSGNVKKRMSHLLYAFTVGIPNAPEVHQAFSQMQIVGTPPEVLNELKKLALLIGPSELEKSGR